MSSERTEELAGESITPSYGVSQELIAEILVALEKSELDLVKNLTQDLHAADVANLINRLDPEARQQFVEVIKLSIDPEVLTYLEDHVKEQVFEQVGPGGIAAAIAELDSDDAVAVLEGMDDQEQREVLQEIPAQNRAMLEEVLTFPEDSAGRLMQREIVCVPTFWTIQEAIDFIRESSQLPEIFYNIYVVDPKYHPVGVVSLDTILRSPPSTPIADIMETAINTIPVELDQEEVAHIFQHYALLSAPVIGPTGRIVGMITVDDIVSVIEKEVEEDIMHLAGVSESDFYAPVLKTSYQRFRWLFVTLVNTLIAATVISQFEKSIEEKVALSFLMVIVAAMGGNSGMQSVTVTVRAIATRELDYANTGKSILKELLVAALIGSIFALILGAVAAVWLNDISVGVVLGAALMCNMMWAGFAGTSLPVIVQRMGLDPAISAGPLLTTTTDVFGYAIFLGLATFFLL